jgi:hypothetical protein
MAQSRYLRTIWLIAAIGAGALVVLLLAETKPEASNAAASHRVEARRDYGEGPRWRTGFRTFPSCGVRRHQSLGPDHSCFEGDAFGAVLISRRLNDIHYRFCWRRPDGKDDCVRKGPIGKRHKSTVSLYTKQGNHAIGTWRLKWKHAGFVIDRDKLHVGGEGV